MAARVHCAARGELSLAPISAGTSVVSRAEIASGCAPQTKERVVFGPHLIIDGSRCDTRKLADRILVEQVLSDYPAAIGMTKIGGPYMFEYQAPDPAYSGISGIVVIAESHIAIHT